MRNTKGKTYEEIYGIEKAKELRLLRKNNAISQMKKQRKGKTHKEIYGEEHAKRISNIKSNKFSGEGNPNYKGGKVELICKQCGNVYLQVKCNEHISNYCSNECKNKSMSNKVIRFCNTCNKEYTTKKSINLKYCSWHCSKIDRKLENNSNWQGGKSFEPYNTNWTSELRDYTRNEDNNLCQLCGKSSIENKRALSVHHIDYDKENCSVYNLISLCVVCHSIVNGNRDYWIKHFSRGVLV